MNATNIRPASVEKSGCLDDDPAIVVDANTYLASVCADYLDHRLLTWSSLDVMFVPRLSTISCTMLLLFSM